MAKIMCMWKDTEETDFFFFSFYWTQETLDRMKSDFVVG